jgi:hypothetical protein
MNVPLCGMSVRAGSPLHTDIQFSEFYRTRLRHMPGARVRSSDLLSAYTAWALAGYGSQIGFKQLKRQMQDRGHRHFYSDSAWYQDVVILDRAEIAASEPRGGYRYDLPYALDLMARLDAITQELVTLRARVAECTA